MSRPTVKSTFSSENTGTLIQSLLGSTKRMVSFFVAPDDEVYEAGIEIGGSHLSDTGDQMDPTGEIKIKGRRIN